MPQLQLGTSDFKRSYAREPEINVVNRFYEQNPANLTSGVGLVSRPGSTVLFTAGAGPIRANYSLKGLFSGDLFTASGEALYRYNGVSATAISGALNSSAPAIKMAGVKGAGYERVFIADGVTLQYYGGQQYQGVLTAAGTIADDIVVIDGIYYQFSVGAPGAGNGTVGTPYKVFVNGSNANALLNLRRAINANGTAGTDYSTGLVANTRVEAIDNTATTLTVRARVAGAPSPSIGTTVTVSGGSDGLSWAAATLQPGPQVLYGVPTPDDVGISSVAVLKSYVLCSVTNSQRVYFIRPGNTTIDPLDFFEAESEPDNLVDIIAVGDQVWLLGESSTEAWYATGDATVIFAPVQGRPFSRGSLLGTPVKLADSVIIVGDDYIAYRITGGAEPISDPSVSERILRSVRIERDNT